MLANNSLNETENLTSLLDFVRWAASRFNEAELSYGHGTETAIDEAANLILHALHLPLDLHSIYFNGALTQSEKQQILKLIVKRINTRMPMAYLTHEAWFAGLAFYVDERVLVPRSPIAELIMTNFEPWVSADQIYHILDLCTGSGCIGIACAYAFPEAAVDLLDNSQDALDVAEINITKHQLQNQVATIKSDLFEQLDSQKYDLIVSNPPYVDQQTLQNLPEEYKHEPVSGFAAGFDGLDCVKKMLMSAADYLTPEGILIVEVGETRQALVNHFPEIPFMWLEFENGGEGVFLLTRQQIITI